jgi:hypothetical protein
MCEPIAGPSPLPTPRRRGEGRYAAFSWYDWERTGGKPIPASVEPERFGAAERQLIVEFQKPCYTLSRPPGFTPSVFAADRQGWEVKLA